jgi:hypothetical protein
MKTDISALSFIRVVRNKNIPVNIIGNRDINNILPRLIGRSHIMSPKHAPPKYNNIQIGIDELCDV